MSDYTKTVDFAAKDALSSGDPSKIVSGTEINTEFTNIQTSNNTKTDKAVPATTNNLAKLDSSGNLADSGFLFSGTGGEVTSTAAELNKLDGTTATAADLTYAATLNGVTDVNTNELEVVTGKTFNVKDASAFKIADVAVTATAAELNYADGPNAASKFCLLDASALVPFAQMLVDDFSGTVSTVSATSWSARQQLTLTNITTVWGVSVVTSTNQSFTEVPDWTVVTDDSYYMRGGTSSAAPGITTPTSGDIDLYVYNPDGSAANISYRIFVWGK